MKPIEGRDTSTYSVESTSCFTAISFKTDSINGIPFNLQGKDELLWAANAEDYYAGYHGRENRARFSINWATGEAELFSIPLPQPTKHAEDDGHEPSEEGGHDGHANEDTAASIGARNYATKWVAFIAGSLLLTVM